MSYFFDVFILHHPINVTDHQSLSQLGDSQYTFLSMSEGSAPHTILRYKQTSLCFENLTVVKILLILPSPKAGFNRSSLPSVKLLGL